MAEEQLLENDDLFILTDEDGKESRFSLLASTEENGTLYLALEPADENPDDSYVILKLVTDENGEDALVTIDDDDEFDRIADIFEDEFMTVEYPDDAQEAEPKNKKKKK